MNTRIKILGFLVVSFFAILVLVTSFTQKNKIKYSGEEMLQLVKSTSYVIDSTELENLTPYIIIDLRSKDATMSNPSPGAINAPLSDLLSKENQALFDRSEAKVFLSDDFIEANEAWMLVRQLGYEDLYVLDIARK
jgi:rhodanese-related sulfurtransferase